MPPVDPLLSAGTRVGKIPVTLSYHIIEHFSKGLYSTPNKAIEELVSNSYDAMGTNVHIILPENVEAAQATIWVIDDGESMDEKGLRDLWLIGESNKRDSGKESAERPPIGKFGIGKLATYVLAKQLTFVCKVKRAYRAVTMDFTRVERKSGESRIKLALRKLTEAEAKTVLNPIYNRRDKGTEAIPLFGKRSPASWTVAAMSELTSMARELQPGRVKWVLSTALPLNPRFKLFFNGQPLLSSRENRRILKTWEIGKNDKVADALKYEPRSSKSIDPAHRVAIPDLGEVSGRVDIYEDALTGGKAEEWGHSNGFFVKVRGRVINPHDRLFGLEPLSHGAFSRFRMEIQADGLDEYLRANRETVLESAAGVKNFREYLRSKFNEARTYYNEWLSQKDEQEREAYRANRTPLSLSRQPLLKAIDGVLDGTYPEGLLLTRVPNGLTTGDKESLRDRLHNAASTSELFKEIRLEPLGMDDLLAIFDVQDQCVKVNMLHPFYANFEEHYQNPTPFKLIGLTEILTEAYLIEENLTLEQVRHILKRRDRFLRELVYSTQLAAPLVAQLLEDNKDSSHGLEDAVYEGLKSLGLEVSKIGGSGKPDGLAYARLGIRDEASGANKSYQLTYDAKSTGKQRVSAKDVNVAGVAKHRRDYKADYALVVAPGFEGENDSNSTINQHAGEHDITLMKVDDLILLVLTASTRPLGFTRLKGLFEKRTPPEARKWIEDVLSEDVPPGPLSEILEAIWEMQEDSPDPIRFAAVRERLASRDKKFKQIRATEIKDWMVSVQRFAGRIVSVDGDIVSLEAPPRHILRELRGNKSKLPELLRNKTMYGNLPKDPEAKIAGKS